MLYLVYESVFWVENGREQLFIEMLLNIIFIINAKNTNVYEKNM